MLIFHGNPVCVFNDELRFCELYKAQHAQTFSKSTFTQQQIQMIYSQTVIKMKFYYLLSLQLVGKFTADGEGAKTIPSTES